jgi:hypothetical protein
VSIDEKILNKILANQIQQHIKNIHHEQVSLNLGMQAWLNIQKASNKQKKGTKSLDHLNR